MKVTWLAKALLSTIPKTGILDMIY